MNSRWRRSLHDLPTVAARVAPESRSPWMRERVDSMVSLLIHDYGLCIPRPIVRAELNTYLTDFASLFHVSRLDARHFVTDEMLRASAREIADQYRT